MIKTAFCLALSFCLVFVAMAAPRTWNLLAGGTVQGEMMGCNTNQIVVQRVGDGELIFIPLTHLTAPDRALVDEALRKKAAAQAAGDPKPKNKTGIEVTRAKLEASPSQFAGSRCWMEAEFVGLDDTGVEHPDEVLGFSVKDKDGAVFARCRADKTKQKDVEVLKLKRGDKVRLTGLMAVFLADEPAPSHPAKLFDTNDAEFYVDKVEPLAPAAKPAP